MNECIVLLIYISHIKDRDVDGHDADHDAYHDDDHMVIIVIIIIMRSS